MIKRIYKPFVGALAMFSLFACGTNNAFESTPNSDNKVDQTSINEDKKSIVVYFSRTNNTKTVANYIADITGSVSYEILAKIPYTDDDIKYYTDCRADREQNDPTARPEIGSETIDLSSYKNIYLGYPIWHGQAPKIMYTFVESYDFSGKTIIPFCTSASSPMGNSATNLSKSTSGANWMEGKRFSQNASKDEVDTWIKSLKL
ncbi:MAG: flavodoxin [Bacilli bacterium]|nr:flavodoxin [Bacilli bacterium]